MKQSEAKHSSNVFTTLYLDIETFSGLKPSVEDIKPDARLKDPEKIQKDKESKQDKEWRKQSLDSVLGEVFCIGLAINDGDTFVLHGETEKETMEGLETLLNGYDPMYIRVIGHNIKQFDALFLFHKALKYRLSATAYLFSDKNKLIDTMGLLDGAAWKTMVSQDKMSKLLLGRSGKGDIDGSMVHDLIVNGEGQKVIDYCGSDVTVLRDCHRVLASMGFGK